MTLREWQELSPVAAARELHHRVQTRLSPAQRRAAIAWLESEPVLATTIEQAREAGRTLGGVPYLAKDLFDVRGTPTFAGSTFLPEVRAADKESTLIAAANGAGLVFAGKTHLHEFAYGITGENPHYGDCEHPLVAGRTTGGSSSGSAAVVAAGIVPVAFGTDTGGSIRVPSAFCGLYGLRLNPADRWIRDAFPLARSFDTAGWFTSTAEDMLTVTHALIGAARVFMEPRLQPRSSPPAAEAAAPTTRPLRGCYVPMPGVDDSIARACAAAAAHLVERSDPATVAELNAAFADALFAYNTTVALEAWEVHREWAARYATRYDPTVWQRLNRVHAITVEDRARADEIRRRVHLAWARYFLAYDFLVLPAAPTVALTKSECTVENRARLLTLTAPASVGGLPVLTLPVRLPNTPLTAGLQIVVNQPLNPAIDWALRVAEEQRGRVFV